MRSRPLILVLCLGLLHSLAFSRISISQRLSVKSDPPIWSKQAIPFDLSCTTKTRVIRSPDHRSSVEISCPGVDLVSGDRHFDVPIHYGANELLWAPDSHAFFVNGGTSGYAGFFVTVYVLDAEKDVREVTLTDEAQMDMVKSFPPCKALRIDRNCGEVAKDPQYNMSGLAWTADSSAIYVFAEVPPSGSYGGIMGQVLGYELAVPSGKIQRRLSAKEVKEQWSKYAAWKVHVPEPPDYDPRK
jgi:hypothetical protein